MPWLSTAASSATPSARFTCCSTSTTAQPWSVGDAPDRLEQPLDDHRREAHAQLVDQQDLRLLDQRPGHGQHLLLAARQRHRRASFQRCSSAGNTLEQRPAASGHPCAAPTLQVLLDVSVVNRPRLSGTRTTPGRGSPASVGRCCSGVAVDRDRCRPAPGAARRASAAASSCRRRSGRAARAPRPASTDEVDVAERRSRSPGRRASRAHSQALAHDVTALRSLGAVGASRPRRRDAEVGLGDRAVGADRRRRRPRR